MKAVIMAGGQGRRLKAVSGDTPKPMVPLLGKPMMEHIVELLRRNGYTEICCALGYRAGDIIAHFGDGSRFGVRMEYRTEDKPLGTAGAVRNCRDFWDGEDFLVISGDCACDFDLSRLMAEHKNRSACATLALYRHSVPLSYGLAVTDSEDIIRCFVEKPGWQRVVTDKVNTGIYVLSPEAMERVPPEKEYDFGKELFPRLIDEGERLLGIPMDGYWCDVGEPLSYYRCCADALSGKLKLSLPEGFVSPAVPEDIPGHEDITAGVDCPCHDRAKAMDALSELMLEMGASFTDGLRLQYPRFSMHIAPVSLSEALRIAVSSPDAEFARELCDSARNIIEAIEREEP